MPEGPLLAYTAEPVSEAKHLDRAMLSTDDAAIASVGRECGPEIPFLRVTELAIDKANSLSEIVDYLDCL